MDMFDSYTEYLFKVFYQRLITMIVIMVVLIGLTIWVFLKKEETGIKVLFIGFILALIIASLFFVLPYGLDAKQQSYVTYTGNYCVEEIVMVKGDGLHAIINVNGETYRMKASFVKNDICLGENEGTIIYSEHTKILFNVKNNK